MWQLYQSQNPTPRQQTLPTTAELKPNLNLKKEGIRILVVGEV